jgi:hypothetical protein
MLKHRLTYANVMATVAMFLALGGGAYAAFKPPKNSIGTKQLKNGSVSTKKIQSGAVTGSKVARHSLTGAQINASTLGTVPQANHASNADRASNADHATSATSASLAGNASELGGSPGSSFQSRVTGTCGANSPIEQVNGNGSVACGHVQVYSGRIVEPLNGSDTFLTIPGVAHVQVLNCLSTQTNAGIVNDATGTTDIWSETDTSYIGSNWLSEGAPLSAIGGFVWHLGQGSGAGADVITVTISFRANGSNCVLQGTAQVITS